MKKLLTYLRDYTKESIIAPLFKLFEASFELIVPLIIAAIIDKGIGAELITPNKPFIVKMTVLLYSVQDLSNHY